MSSSYGGNCVHQYTHVLTPTQTLVCRTELFDFNVLFNVTIYLGNQVQPIGMFRIAVTVFAGLVLFSPILVFSVIAIGMIVVLVAICCWRVRRKFQKQDKLLTTLLRAEHRQIEMATESIRGEHRKNYNA